MGLMLQEFIEAPSVYACLICRAHIAKRDDVISRTFQGRLGRAYLTESVVNARLGEGEDRLLMTGMHTVCNLHCRLCDSVIGWKYVHAFDKSQQYKEGRYVLEQSRIYSIDQPVEVSADVDLLQLASCELGADVTSSMMI
ncbi:yippee zinc-binding/DNA-binding /Mis18, centromere assembly-domain-containing protein [Kickxella alabastrina]|uniref:yippee zinc-binding/DNA-binding /Mis18, centromere assembly-domain-containing protein n=1 Tax=Kickxella alabastrina TaxID=61397 RepID=UPI00221F34CB|nr:yippee zinc-binding/DNA-binding /Mis18, centromere assembly-domain-containing protein [Kickxella alabastrina]KAI7822256.1 yippee zinc-binding/DNA-binding /Mis18, centromere assembly-domain-containing protein [Kickxella alabastrina]KAJ1947337.1 hypothetical protein GGF37_000519 [Kickxella alabastrina]